MPEFQAKSDSVEVINKQLINNSQIINIHYYFKAAYTYLKT